VTLAGVLSGLLSTEAAPCSTIYVGLNLRSSRKYFGLVEDRNPLLRFKEHWAAIDDHHRGTEANFDWKYNYMARQGGAAAWIFLPLISLPVVIPKHRLRTLEKLLIARNPTSVNCENRRRFATTLVVVFRRTDEQTNSAEQLNSCSTVQLFSCEKYCTFCFS
jgi:hypothetical protein